MDFGCEYIEAFKPPGTMRGANEEQACGRN